MPAANLGVCVQGVNFLPPLQTVVDDAAVAREALAEEEEHSQGN